MQFDNQNHKILFNLGILISFIVVFTLTYSPALKTYFLFSDDYSLVEGSTLQEQPSLLDVLKTTSSEGKFIFGFYLYGVSRHIESANAIRLIGIIGLGLLAYLIYSFLKHYRIGTGHAFLVSILVCTLPSYQLFISWLVCVSYIYSAILSTIAGILSFKVLSENTKDPLKQRAFLFVLSVALFVAALHINQPASITYWAAGVIPLMALRDKDFTDRWQIPFIRFFFAGFVALAVYYCTVKILLFIFKIGLVSRGAFIELSQIPLKLKWFFYCPLSSALNLWKSSPTYTLAGIVGATIIALFLIHFLSALKKENKADLLWNNCQRLFFITGILFLSYLPNLIVTSNVSPNRTIVSLAMVICFLLYFSFAGLLNFTGYIPGFSADLKDKATTILLLALALATTYSAHNNVNDFAKRQADEFNYVKAVISEFGISRLSERSTVHIIRPDGKELIERGGIYDDSFIRPTTTERREGTNLVRVALRELGIKAKLKVTIGESDETVPEDKDLLVIDMTKFDYSGSYNTSITTPQKYCITIPKRL